MAPNLADDFLEIVSQQRFAARQTNLCDAKPGQDANESFDLGNGQDPRLGKRIEASWTVPRAAINTVQIAARRDGEPQVGDGTAVLVKHG